MSEKDEQKAEDDFVKEMHIPLRPCKTLSGTQEKKQATEVPSVRDQQDQHENRADEEPKYLVAGWERQGVAALVQRIAVNKDRIG